MALLREQERICRELGNPAGLEASLGNQASLLWHLGDPEGAAALHREEEQICRNLGDAAGLATSLANQAELLQKMGLPREALPAAREASRLASEHGLTALIERFRPIVDRLEGGS